MKYDFDKIIDRSGTNALKYSVLKERYGRDDLIPLWVADLDLRPLISLPMPCASVWSIRCSAIPPHPMNSGPPLPSGLRTITAGRYVRSGLHSFPA